MRRDWSDHIWTGIIVLAVASIFSLMLSFSAQLIGALLGGAALLAAIDIILDRIRHKDA